MARWAHILWQNHSLRFEDFYDMSPRLQKLYIASEIIRGEEVEKAKARAKVRVKTAKK